MRCMEVFYRRWEAEKYAEELEQVQWKAEPEVVETIDEDVNEPCWIVYFNPKPLRKHMQISR